MMRPHTLKEFAENLRVAGDWREVEFATEILDFLDLEADVAEPYGDLCDDIAHYAPTALKGAEPGKIVEWLGDRSAELDEVYGLFTAEELQSENVPDQIRERFDALKEIEAMLCEQGLRGSGELPDAIFDLIERIPPAREYDL